MTESPSASSAAERMQALLSRAVEEQVSEQRAVSTVLVEVKQQLELLAAAAGQAANNHTVAELEQRVGTVMADQRTATTLLSQRLEALTARIESLASLDEQIRAQAAALDDVESSLSTFAAFPQALAALQRDVAGVHDRLAPLADLRSALNDLTIRTTGRLDEIRPQLQAVVDTVAQLPSMPSPEQLRDAVVDALSGRLERLQEAADRPVVGPEALRRDLGDLRASIGSAVAEQLDTVRHSVGELGTRLDRTGERLDGLTESVGAVPALGEQLTELGERVDALQPMLGRLDIVAQKLAALGNDTTGTAIKTAVEGLAEDLGHLSEQVDRLPSPTLEEISNQVSARVADRLVETLAPRIADVVLTRVGAALVNQLGAAIAPQLQADTEATVLAATRDSEARVLAHVDESLLALAEALLRRKGLRRGKAGSAAGAGEVSLPPVSDVLRDLEDGAPAPAAEEPEEPVAQEPEPVEELPQAEDAGDEDAGDEGAGDEDAELAAARPAPAPDPRPAVTTGLAPAAPRTPAPPAEEAPLKRTQAARPAAAGKKAGARPAPAAKKAPARPAAAPKPAPRQAVQPPKPATRPAAKAPAKRPARPRPLLERTPDLDTDAGEPVRPAAQRPSPARPSPARPVPPAPQTPALRQAPPSTVLPQQPLPTRTLPAPPSPASPPQREPEKGKRKPWWRPGG